MDSDDSLKWTQEKPKVRGFYFYKEHKNNFSSVLEIEYSDNPKVELLVYRGNEKKGKSRNDYNGWWAGPLNIKPPPDD